MLQKNHIDLNR